MNSLLELLKTLCPYAATAEEDMLSAMLEVAESFAPACLPEHLKNRAIVYYAGYLAVNAMTAKAQGLTNIPMGVTSEQEGDLRRSYGHNGVGGDTYGYLAEWEKLDKLCKRAGGIVVSDYSEKERCCGGCH